METTEKTHILQYIKKQKQLAVEQTLIGHTKRIRHAVGNFFGSYTVAVMIPGISSALLKGLAEQSKDPKQKQKYALQLWLDNALQNTTDFSTLVVQLLEIKGYQNDYPRFYNKAEIDRRLFSKIIAANTDYHPEIKTVFKLIIGLELDLEQANALLTSASYAFGTNVFHLIIRYCVENGVYEHETIDEYLAEFCGETLYSIK